MSTPLPPNVLPLDVPPLPPAATEQEFALHRAALEWSLADPIVIRGADDIRGSASWKDRVEPFAHQVRNLITYCRRLPVTLLADDVGLGKTISAGLVLSELMVRERVRRTLVLAPKVLLPQWVDEMQEKFGIAGVHGSGAEFDGLVDSGAQLVVTTYETARSRLAEVPDRTFDMLILDEAHRLRNLYPDVPPAMAKAVRDAMAARRFPFVLMLTATPMQNRLWDLYSLVDCMAAARGHRNPFGKPAEFQRTYCTDATGRSIRPDKVEAFRGILSQYVARTRRGDAKLVFPERIVRMERAKPSSIERKVLDIVSGLAPDLGRLAQISVLQAQASSREALEAQLETMATRNAACGEALAELRALERDPAGGSKARMLMELLTALRDARGASFRAVVFTGRRETQSMLVRLLEAGGFAVGTIRGGEGDRNAAHIEAFKANPPRVQVIVSTDAGAEGVNLQAANVLVNIDLPWNPMRLEQRIGRIQRLGSSHRSVEILNVVLGGTFEEQVVGLLATKLQTVAASVGDIEAILESTGADDDDGFEESLRDLVLRSLRGQDVGLDLRAKQESWSEAKRTMAEHEQQIDVTLGQLDALHRTGAKPPELRRCEPSLDARTFVMEALAAEGAQPMDEGNDTISFLERGARVQASLARRTPAGHRSLAPGSTDFERLVGRWSSRSAHRVRQGPPPDAQSIRSAVGAWAAERGPGAQITALAERSREPAFAGRMQVCVRVSNGFDSYDTIIDHGRAPTRGIAGGESISDATLDDPDLPASILAKAQEVALADPSVRGFVDFYGQRCAEELARAERAQASKVAQDHRCTVAASLVALDGAISTSVQVAVTVVIEGQPYEASLWVHGTGGVVSEPMVVCSVTGAVLPGSWTEACAVTGERALRHRLVVCGFTGARMVPAASVTSAVSGRLLRRDQAQCSAVSGSVAHPSELVRDSRTGEWLLRTEAGRSMVSGRIVRRDCMVASQRDPSRWGAQDEAVVCAVTGKVLLQDEVERCTVTSRVVDRTLLKRSDVDGVWALPDQCMTCPWSGDVCTLAQAVRCSLTQVAVSPRAIGARGMLRPFAELLPAAGGTVPPDRIALIRGLHPSLAKCKEATSLGSRSGSVLALVARTSGFLGIRPRSVALLVTVAADGAMTVMGLSAPLRPTGLGWEPAA
jgi:superfamily II DNA or RNA helicase